MAWALVLAMLPRTGGSRQSAVTGIGCRPVRAAPSASKALLPCIEGGPKHSLGSGRKGGGGCWVGGAPCRFRHRPSSQFMQHHPRIAGAVPGALLAHGGCRGGRRSKPLSPPSPGSYASAHCRRRRARRCQCGLSRVACSGLRVRLWLQLAAFHVRHIMHPHPRAAPLGAYLWPRSGDGAAGADERLGLGWRCRACSTAHVPVAAQARAGCHHRGRHGSRLVHVGVARQSELVALPAGSCLRAWPHALRLRPGRQGARPPLRGCRGRSLTAP